MTRNLTTNTNKAAEVCHTGAAVPEDMIFMQTCKVILIILIMLVITMIIMAL